MIRWHDLAPAQQAAFGNGCGPRWLPQRLVKWLNGLFFEASCRRHDFAYWRGGSERDRRAADAGFLSAMLRDVQRLSGLRKLAALSVCCFYFVSVSLFGDKFFQYGRYRTLIDLQTYFLPV